MRLNEIKDNPGSKKTRVRIGRGIGSGMGKMGGRGGKGQSARSGVRLGGFEGGQMPLHRRLPKRGFNSLHPLKFNEVNVGAIQRALDEKVLDGAKPIDNVALVAAGILRRPKDGLRILGDGDLKSKVAISANHVSASAKAAIEKSGGTVTLIVKKVLEADEKKRAKTAAKKAKAAGGGVATKKKSADE
jgi:large subunit ribosomal protein L15